MVLNFQGHLISLGMCALQTLVQTVDHKEIKSRLENKDTQYAEQSFKKNQAPKRDSHTMKGHTIKVQNQYSLKSY